MFGCFRSTSVGGRKLTRKITRMRRERLRGRRGEGRDLEQKGDKQIFFFEKNESRIMWCLCISRINFSTPEPIVMKVAIHIMPPRLNLPHHLNGVLHESLPSVCASLLSLIGKCSVKCYFNARQRGGKHVPKAKSVRKNKNINLGVCLGGGGGLPVYPSIP
jgi:hypothetical protein